LTVVERPATDRPGMPDAPLITAERSPLQGFFEKPGLASVFVRLCIYLILGAAITYVLTPVARAIAGRGATGFSPRLLMASEGIALAGVLVAAWILSLLERRPIGQYGLPAQRNLGRLLAQGAVFGIVEISAVLGALAALGYYHFGDVAVRGGALIRWALIWGVFFLIVGLYEEFTFRGYVQFTLAQGLGFWPAAVALSLLFGAVHRTNPGETPVGLAGIVVSGLFWSFTLRRTGNLWFAVGMHASFDFGETFLYSVPDSGVVFPGHLSDATLAGPAWLTGGTAGPEASVFDFVMILAFVYVFSRLYPSESRAR
jgi:uncharacterized protein